MQFTNILAVRELSGGVVITDAVELLMFLGWDSAATVQIGRQGRGPGEYSRVGPLFPLADDSTVVLDQNYGRWILLDGSEVVETVGEARPLNRLMRTRVTGFDELGNVLGERRFNVPGAKRPLSTPDSVVLLLGNRATETFDSLARFPGEGGSGPFRLPSVGGRPPWVLGHNPLASRDQSVLFPDGWIAVVREEPYRVDWRKPGGGWRRGEPLPHRRIEVDQDEQCAAMARVTGSRPCDPAEIPEWPAELPPFVRSNSIIPVVFAAPTGHVVVRRLGPHEEEGVRYDVIDRLGDRVAVLWLDRGERIVGFGDTSVFTVSRSEYDLESLRRHLWPPSSLPE